MNKSPDSSLHLILKDVVKGAILNPYPGAKHCCKAEPPPFRAEKVQFCSFFTIL